MFGSQRAKEHYRTKGYREALIYLGLSQSSYRHVCRSYNRRVGQAQGDGLQASSLQYEARAEAKRLQDQQAHQVKQILRTHQFDEQGDPQEACWSVSLPQQQPPTDLDAAFAAMCTEAPPALRASLQLDRQAYEEVAQSTYVAIDDVCNKAQKTDRSTSIRQPQASPYRKDGKKAYAKRRFLFHTVAKIIAAPGKYTLTAPRITLLWPALMALLLYNQRLNTQWIFLVDGQRMLHEYLTHHLRWRPIRLLLDWYHLRKKIHMQIYMALLKTQQRDQIMFQLEQLLWYGLVPQAIQLIDQISVDLIKDQEQLDVLRAYFERHIALIPNYALRKKLGLILSSNRVEKENDYLVSNRQKHQGMSWTRDGSDALAVITAIQRNQELDGWLNHHHIDMKLVA